MKMSWKFKLMSLLGLTEKFTLVLRWRIHTGKGYWSSFDRFHLTKITWEVLGKKSEIATENLLHIEYAKIEKYGKEWREI